MRATPTLITSQQLLCQQAALFEMTRSPLVYTVWYSPLIDGRLGVYICISCVDSSYNHICSYCLCVSLFQTPAAVYPRTNLTLLCPANSQVHLSWIIDTARERQRERERKKDRQTDGQREERERDGERQRLRERKRVKESANTHAHTCTHTHKHTPAHTLSHTQTHNFLFSCAREKVKTKKETLDTDSERKYQCV